MPEAAGQIRSGHGSFQLYVISARQLLYVGITELLAVHRWSAHFTAPNGSFLAAVRRLDLDPLDPASQVTFVLYNLCELVDLCPPEGRLRALKHVEHELHLALGRSRRLGVSKKLISDTVRTAPKNSALSAGQANAMCAAIVSDLEARLADVKA